MTHDADVQPHRTRAQCLSAPLLVSRIHRSGAANTGGGPRLRRLALIDRRDGQIALTAVGWIAIALLLLIVSALLIARTFHNGAYPMDEGTLLVYPTRVLDGDVPNRDFEHFYGPGNLWLLATTYFFAGVSVTVERSVGIAYRLVIILAIFALARRSGAIVAVAAGLVAAFILAALGSSALAWFGGFALALSSLALATERLRARDDAQGDASGQSFLAGLLAGLALVFRLDLALAVILSSLALLPSASRRERRAHLLGLIVGASPYAVHIWLAGLRPAVRGLIIDPISVQSSGRRLPLPPDNSAVAAVLYLVVLSALGLLAWSLYRWHSNPGATQDRRLLAVALFSVGILPQMFQRDDIVHVLFGACLPLAFLPVLLATIARQHAPRLTIVAAAGGVALVLFLTARAVDKSIAVGVFPSYAVQHDGRSFPLPSKLDAPDMQLFLADVDRIARPGQRLFVGPRDLRRTNYNDTYLYFLLPKLEPATYFLEMNPGSANRVHSRLAADIRSADLLILTDAYDQSSEPNSSRDFGPTDPGDVVRDDFCALATRSHWTLLARCASRN